MSGSDPAFPQKRKVNIQELAMHHGNGATIPREALEEFCPGLTKRELFAAVALQGLIASPNKTDNHCKLIAQDACKLADALLAELERK